MSYHFEIKKFNDRILGNFAMLVVDLHSDARNMMSNIFACVQFDIEHIARPSISYILIRSMLTILFFRTHSC